jgi:hypothetical protein
VQAKAGIQPKESTGSEDVAHGGGGTRWFDQFDSLLLCDSEFQLPPDLKALVSCWFMLRIECCKQEHLDKFESYP